MSEYTDNTTLQEQREEIATMLECGEGFIAEHETLLEYVDAFIFKVQSELIEEWREYLKTVIPCEMPQEIWNIGVDNTCNRMLEEKKNDI